MSLFYTAVFVRKGAQDTAVARRYPRALDIPASLWWVCEYGDHYASGLFEGLEMTPELSAELGEVILLGLDAANDQLEYEHSRDGQLLRKLTWASDGSQSTWLSVAGEPESWETSVLFSPPRLAHALERLSWQMEDLGADAEWLALESEQVRACFRAQCYRLAGQVPPGDAYFADLIRRHFGLLLPGD
jgi:hypothetical protein